VSRKITRAVAGILAGRQAKLFPRRRLGREARATFRDLVRVMADAELEAIRSSAAGREAPHHPRPAEMARAAVMRRRVVQRALRPRRE
jgi:hypothetical protein